MNYQEFLKGKEVQFKYEGIDPKTINKKLYDFQQAIVSWSIKKGRCAVFADCGMGKTLMQLDWCANMPGRSIIAAPLAVALQPVHGHRQRGILLNFEKQEVYRDRT